MNWVPLCYLNIKISM